MIPMHPARRHRTHDLSTRDPDNDWLDIYRQSVLWEFPAEYSTGYQLAFHRPEAVPRMAAVIAGTGHLEANPMRRTFDTGIVLLELIHGGFESPRGRQMVRLMRRLHDHPRILQEDLTYVLNSLIVIPSQFVDKVGWRRLLPVEQIAAWRFWCELGRRMGVEHLPPSYEVAEQEFTAYEAHHLAPSPEGQRLTKAILGVFEPWFPRLLQPHTTAITSALFDDPQVSHALGLPPPRRTITAALAALYTLRRGLQRLSPPRSEPAFTPGQPAGKIYPAGYDLDHIGPETTST